MKKTLYVNDAYMPFIKATQRIQIFYGGSSSGKSFFLAQRCVMDVINGRNYLIVRNVGATIRFSVYNQIIKTIQAMGLENLFRVTNSGFAITCKRNGKQILFSGLDDVEKLKSITPATGILTDIWIEEATEVPYEAYKQLTKRLRGLEDGEDIAPVPKRVTFSFNPVLQTHWIYREFFDIWDDSKNLYKTDSLLIRKTTYKDNNFLAPDDITALESEKDPYFYNVYTLGNWGILGNLIYRNWRVEDLSEQRKHFDNYYCGLDFGYTNPNAFIRIHYDGERKRIYVLDELYASGQQYEELAADIINICGREPVTCDSEDARGINRLASLGVTAIPARKGSVLSGINWLREHEIIIDVRCQNFKNEIQAYHWREDKFGNVLEQPVKELDHLLDALRYSTESIQINSKMKAGKRL